MKKILLLAIVAFSALSSLAELSGNGYYRLQNALTKRYTYLMDNKGSVDVATSSADVGALELYTGFLRASSDPATVFYLENHSGSEYNVRAQGTDLYTFLGAYLKIIKGKQFDGQQSYYAYASKSGLTKYIGDIRSDNSNEKGYPSADAKGDTRLWYINPLTVADDNYFGVAPTVTAGGKYYYPMFAGFPYSAHSDGVRFYVVSRIEPAYGVAVISEVNGTVPANVPVIIECANPLAADNRLAIGAYGSGDNIPSNFLKGIYFDNPSTNRHHNQTPYDKQTMRSLATVDGKLMFVKGDYEFCPRNQSYLSLPTAAAQAVDNYQVMTEEEFAAYEKQLEGLNPDGYYRLQNASSKRYAYIIDNKGSVSDMNAFRLAADIVKASSDPASVMRMTRPSGGNAFQRILSSQTASTNQILGGYLTVKPADEVAGRPSYTIAASAGNLGDAGGVLAAGVSGAEAQWHLDAVNAATDNHFGIAPSVTAEGKYYHTFMADFPVAAYSPDVKFYIVTRVDYELEAVVIRQVEGVIPAGKAVIVECAGPLASDNRLVVGAEGAPADLTDNLLGSVYFDNAAPGHVNNRPYDSAAMRSLTSVDGKLVFAPANVSYVPRNQAYLPLWSSWQQNVTAYNVLTEPQYEDLQASSMAPMADGYYRIRNIATGRSMYMADNTGSLPDAASADFGGIRMAASETLISDPASVFSFRINTSQPGVPFWSISAQNSSFVKVATANMKLLPAGSKDGSDVFKAYVFKDNRKVFFADDVATSENEAPLAGATNAVNGLWKFNRIDVNDDSNCLGLTPTVQTEGRYYRPFMAEFPFRTVSEGMKVYIVSKIDTEKAVMVMKPIQGSVPPCVPVIVECAGPSALDNRIEIVTSGTLASTDGNLLSAVWFDSGAEGHVNRTPFDGKSMRILSISGDRPVFTNGVALDYVPRNQAYMSLSAEAELGIADYQVLTEEEYTGVHGVDVIPDASFVDVYTPDGVLVRKGMPKSDVITLPHGVYLLRSGACVEKHFVN